ARAVPVESGAPAIPVEVGGAVHPGAPAAGVDGERGPGQPPPGPQAVPLPGYLEGVVGRPLEPFELEGDVPHRRHQLVSPASGSSGCRREGLERATGAPVSVGGGRWSTAATRRRRSRPSTATLNETFVRLK